MNDVSLFVNHNISIVSVFDLEEVTDKRIGRHTADKVGSGLKGGGRGREVYK